MVYMDVNRSLIDWYGRVLVAVCACVRACVCGWNPYILCKVLRDLKGSVVSTVE